MKPREFCRTAKEVFAIFAMLLPALMAAAQPTEAQTFTVLHQFNGSDGSGPDQPLLQDDSGNIYGTTGVGGGNTFGVVFKLDKSNNETVLLDFNQTNGAFPTSGLILDKAKNLYGNALEGPGGSGVIFRLSPKGQEKLLFTFQGCFPCGKPLEPAGALLRDKSGNLIGATHWGGGGSCERNGGCGTIFKLDRAGKLHVLYTFHGHGDGTWPTGPLAHDIAGNLYGTAMFGGDMSCSNGQGCGTVFKLTPNGKLTVLHTFEGTPDGAGAQPGLVLDKGGNLYGTAFWGGSNCQNSGYPKGCGTLFKVSQSGKFAVVHSFTGEADGNFPNGGLVQDPEGNLYGTTATGSSAGASPYGTVFKVDKAGVMTVLHSLNGNSDGATPLAGLIRDSAGNLYGTAYTNFGFNINGTVFKVTR